MTKSFATRLSALMLSAAILAGCVDAPPTTPQVTEIKTESLGLTGAPVPRAPEAWWTAFEDPQVNRLAAQVMANNPGLSATLARMRAAQAELSVSRAEDRPQFSLDANEQRVLFSKDYIIPPPYGGTWRWYGQAVGNLSWNLDFWGKQAALIEKSRGLADAAALDAEAARLALSGSFAQAYIDLLLNYQNGDIADAAVAERAEILKITQSRFDAGLENIGAVEQVKALLANAQADQARYAAAREADVHAIAALAGQGAEAYATITRPTPKLDTALPLPTTLPADLLARRPDVLAAKARVSAALQGREAAHAEFFPDINIAGLVGFQSIGLSNLLTGNSFTLGAGPAVHLPIFDAGRIRAQYAGATAQVDVAVSDYNGAVVNAIRQAADAMTQVRSLAEQRARRQQAVDSAERAFRVAEERYRSGLATQIPMLTAEATLLQARQALAAAVAESAIQRITLLLTMGGSFQNPAAQAANDPHVQIAKQDVRHD